MKPALYVFEGPNGVGKTVLSSYLHSILNQQGRSSELVSLPGRKKGTIGELIYRLYHDPYAFGVNHISIIPEQLLFTAAHADVIESEILPVLLRGQNVVLDRFWWSTWVYSSIGGLPTEIRDLLLELELKIWSGIKPRGVFLLRRNRPPDSEHSVDKWEKLVSLYNEICSQQSERVKVIEVDNNADIQDAMAIISDFVERDAKL